MREKLHLVIASVIGCVLLISDWLTLPRLWLADTSSPLIGCPQGAFVAAFANTNEGDVTPDVAGPTCVDTSEPCDYVTSTCPSNPTDVSHVTW